MKSVRGHHLIAAVIAGAVILTGCSTSHAGSGTSSNSSDTSAGGIQSGGTLTVALEDDLRDPSNIQLSTSQDHLVMASTVYDPLFTTNKKDETIPALATGATPSNNFKTWTFTLRSGVKFQNGKPFTAESVKENLDQFLDPKNASDLAGNLANIKNYSVVSPTSIKINLKTPDANLPATFTDNIYMAYEPFNPNHPVGTGPYSWVTRVPGDHITFKRNPYYWRGRPPLDQVVFQVITDPTVAALDLEKGVVDVYPAYATTEAVTLMKRDPNLRVYSTPGLVYYNGFLNFEKDRRGGYKNGQDVRQGLADLWDPEKIIPPIVGASGKIATQVIPSFIKGSDPSIQPWPYNPTEGMRLLAEGGIPHGGKITLIAEARANLCAIMTAYQSNLHSLGYNVSATCLQPEVAQKTVTTYTWDVAFWQQSLIPLAVAELQQDWSTAIVPNPPTDVNTLRDAHLQSVLNQWTATPYSSPDYQTLGHQAAQIIVKKDVATLPAYWQNAIVAANKNVMGIVDNPENYYGFLMNGTTTVWLKH